MSMVHADTSRKSPPSGGPNEWFSAKAEAENCERILGDRRHGLDSILKKNKSEQEQPKTSTE